jgi:lycopene beta-cyclase
MASFDYVLVGGGLQNGLCALAIRAHRPAARIAVVERGRSPGGNHTWCFHEDDVDAQQHAWIEPLVVHRWRGYDVAFPELHRRIDAAYAAVTSARLAERLGGALAVPGSELLTGAVAESIGEHEVTVRTAAGPRQLTGTVVIDARGPDVGEPPPGGFQKFVGLEVRTAAPHRLERPILMDAEVPQLDGFRFFYVLPLGPDRLLVEDTRFADGTYLDLAALRAACLGYAAGRGWEVAEVIREEHGVLPLPFRIDLDDVAGGPLRGGIQGGWFHPTTGYSFPVAARLAALVGAFEPEALHGAELAALRARHRRQLDVALALNRMLFRWFAPADRRHVLERFYRLPEPTIRRFYALDLRFGDVVRLFAGRPPRGLSWRAVVTGARSSP